MLEELRDDAVGIVTALNHSADLRHAANRQFANAWEVHRQPPTTYAMASYDAATQMLDKAIRLTAFAAARSSRHPPASAMTNPAHCQHGGTWA